MKTKWDLLKQRNGKHFMETGSIRGKHGGQLVKKRQQPQINDRDYNN